MHVQRIAAFSRNGEGGNPAGVVLCEALPEASRMQALAADVGYSETVFAAPREGGWRVRYFAPAAEVPFCGHATIALGAALALAQGGGVFDLELNDARITVEGCNSEGRLKADLQSPPTRNEPAPFALLGAALDLFSLHGEDLDRRIPPAIIDAGARHLLLPLADRQRLAKMSYEMQAGAELMQAWELATISLVYAESPSRFHARNPFAGGGVYEDPATGAAAAALAGYLRDASLADVAPIEIIQGQDMGVPCLIHAHASAQPGGSVRVSGAARVMA